MVLRVAGYKLPREEATKFALKTGGYDYNSDEGKCFASTAINGHRQKLPIDHGSLMTAPRERRRTHDPRNGLRGVVDDLEFLVIEDPNFDEFEQKFGTRAPYSLETTDFLKGKYTTFRLPKPGEIKPFDSEDLSCET
ncbi:hypothetical protein Hypma_004405 [Hypsizygus marmoreus]|uniref:Uncharacterized protein n=1 Tax=Hypsizygus marmoreus TaxID=39966 RepID=A0A369K641_HYPMA|nr:hypothetical protein Hypma_004405 [Hypsizygus marmoreus]